MLAARPYQRDAITSLHEGWKDPAILHQLVCAATGAGKTPIFSILASEETERDGTVLILAHTDELIDQAIDKFCRFTGMQAGKEKAQSFATLEDKVVVASVQTLRNKRLQRWPHDHFTLVIVDEAHRSMATTYQAILQYFASGGARVVGVTATADRGDGKGLGDFYHRIAYDYPLRRAVDDGWLVRPVVKTMPVKIDLSGVEVKKSVDGADLDRAEVGRRLVPFMKTIAEAIKAEIGGEKVLLFLPSVETAGLMSDALNLAGIASEWVCGDKNLCPNRTDIVARHKRGAFQALCNMAVLTEGYDDDTIKNIVCLRPTKIRSLYVQILGRASRPIGDIVAALNAAEDGAARRAIIKASSKPYFKILDFLWLYEKHNIMTPASLLTTDEKVQRAMVGVDGDLIESQAKAEQSLLERLAKEVQKHSNKKTKVIDPFAFAGDLGDTELANYTPTTDYEKRPPSLPQLETLKQNGVRVEAVTSFGQASKLIGVILERHKQGLCTVRQLNFLNRLRVPNAANFTRNQATAKIIEITSRREEKRKEDQLVLDVGTLFTPTPSLLVPPPKEPHPEEDMLDVSTLFGGGA